MNSGNPMLTKLHQIMTIRHWGCPEKSFDRLLTEFSGISRLVAAVCQQNVEKRGQASHLIAMLPSGRIPPDRANR
jgi:hypothetical protein